MFKQRTPISRLVKWTEETIAFGDDKGRIKVWDVRQDKCCLTFKAHKDRVSDLTYVSDMKTIIGVSSSEGYYSRCDLVAGKVCERSPFTEETFGLEYLSVVALKEKQIICGTQTGLLQLHSVDTSSLEWYCSNELKNPVDAMVKLDEENIIVGSAGSINLMNLAQKGIFQRIGEHGTSSVQRLGLSYDNKYLGSTSCGDPILKLWDLKDFMPDSGISDSAASKKSSKVQLSEGETPAKVKPKKKRSSDSEHKTPAANKKVKLGTPQKTGGKTGGASHVATPHPSKQTEEKPATSSNRKTPKSGGGSRVGKSSSKTFGSEAGLESHTKAKDSAGK